MIKLFSHWCLHYFFFTIFLLHPLLSLCICSNNFFHFDFYCSVLLCFNCDKGINTLNLVNWCEMKKYKDDFRRNINLTIYICLYERLTEKKLFRDQILGIVSCVYTLTWRNKIRTWIFCWWYLSIENLISGSNSNFLLCFFELVFKQTL